MLELNLGFFGKGNLLARKLTDISGRSSIQKCKLISEFNQMVRKRTMRAITKATLLSVLLHGLTATASAEEGTASYYADSLHGNPTASGEPYDKNAMTAAHLDLPFGTRVRVTNLSNNKSVVVRINDRGPHTKGRIIDVSGAAAEKLGLLDSGTAEVFVEIME